jgi:hypothetical protein
MGNERTWEPPNWRPVIRKDREHDGEGQMFLEFKKEEYD